MLHLHLLRQWTPRFKAATVVNLLCNDDSRLLLLIRRTKREPCERVELLRSDVQSKQQVFHLRFKQNSVPIFSLFILIRSADNSLTYCCSVVGKVELLLLCTYSIVVAQPLTCLVHVGNLCLSLKIKYASACETSWA